ncbi:MAG: helix-turn-helix transcriptional regulator [Alphaproteobacteria bacterium]|nr:helix-turn-helix transcriptional regulator [Alphaproteobacteria bacterium SS10]
MDGGRTAFETGHVSVTQTRAAYTGPGLALDPHRNAVATIAIDLDRPYQLTLFDGADKPGSATSKTIALIPPGQLHHLVAMGPMAFLYLDALSDDHHALQHVDLSPAYDRLMAAGAAALKDADALAMALGVPTRGAPDPRLVPIIRQIDEEPEAFDTIAGAAALVPLSPSRFQALFRQATGLPFRRYRLWRRMARVVTLLRQGRDLTMAAHEAGFASSGHLSAAFKDMFGLTPSALHAILRAGPADNTP